MIMYDCLIERDSQGWYGWISPLDDMGNITDEYITRRFSRKHGAVVRLKEIANKMGLDGAGDVIDGEVK